VGGVVCLSGTSKRPVYGQGQMDVRGLRTADVDDRAVRS